MHLAIIGEYIEAVYAIIRLAPIPALLDIRNDDAQAPIHLAVMTKQPNIVRKLLVAGAKVSHTFMYTLHTILFISIDANFTVCYSYIILYIRTSYNFFFKLDFPILNSRKNRMFSLLNKKYAMQIWIYSDTIISHTIYNILGIQVIKRKILHKIICQIMASLVEFL